MKRIFLATTIVLGLAFTGSGVASAAAPTQKCVDAQRALDNLQHFATTVPANDGLNLLIANAKAAVDKRCKVTG